MAKRDYYEVLGLARSANDDEIKRTYRRLAKKYHPDRNRGDKSAEDKFKEVQEAYEVLNDAKKRELYDRFGHSGGPGSWQENPNGQRVYRWSPGQGGGVDFTSLDDIFEFLGRGGQSRAGRSPFEDLFGGFGGGGGRSRRTAHHPRPTKARTPSKQ